MDFNFTDEQELLVESIKEYADRYWSDDQVKEMYRNHKPNQEAITAYR